jgi:hypothetical protein
LQSSLLWVINLFFSFFQLSLVLFLEEWFYF